MNIIPLDIQRRSERQWAARFAQPLQSVAPPNKRIKQIDRLGKGKRKTDQIEAVSSRPLSLVWSSD